MAISRMKAENRVALLRSAASKVRQTRIPHVITEDRWVASSSDDITSIRYEDRLYFPLFSNIERAWRSLFPKSEFERVLMNFSQSDGRLAKVRDRILMTYVSLRHTETSLPDATVNGNIVHWQEHAFHIALWSPEIAGAVYDMLTAEADRIEKALKEGTDVPSTTKELMDLAAKLVDKEVWRKTTPRLRPVTKKELLGRDFALSISRHSKIRKRFALARFQFAKVGRFEDPQEDEISREISFRYGHLSPKKAYDILQRQNDIARTNSAKEGKNQDYWVKAVNVTDRYVEVLGDYFTSSAS